MVPYVKGVHMETTPTVWKLVAGLKPTSVKVGKGNFVALEDFNKIQFFKRFSIGW